MRRRFTWRLRSRSLELGERTLIMGVLNVTPDSFSDGGRYLEPAAAVEHALRMLDEGADMLDIGGESTRPGAPVADQACVTAEEELRRILPVIEAVKCRRPDALLSVDTYKSETAHRAVLAGAEIVNDVSAGRWDALMLPTISDLHCGCVLMHSRGRPEEWRALPPAGDIVGLVRRELARFVRGAVDDGIDRDRIVLDPGFGFGKNYDDNYPLLARFPELAELEYPLLAGTSHKRFVGRTLAHDGVDRPVSGRLYGSLSATTAAILKGAHIVRVHDVAPARDAARIADQVLAAELPAR